MCVLVYIYIHMYVCVCVSVTRTLCAAFVELSQYLGGSRGCSWHTAEDLYLESNATLLLASFLSVRHSVALVVPRFDARVDEMYLFVDCLVDYLCNVLFHVLN